jgi:uncharacterized protein (TIGR02266 family)
LEISFLRRADCEILTAEDGIEALKLAKTVHPDIILLDVEMPRMTGIECCRHIKSDPNLKGIPVVMVTATNRRVECEKAGCDDYWRKPIREEDFLRGIKKLVPIKEREDKRVCIGLQVEYQKGGKTISAFTKDISATGMFIITRETLQVDSNVEISFTLPESRTPLKIAGKVIRELKDAEDGHYVGGMGVLFKKMDDDTQKAILSFVESSLQDI